MPPQLNLPPPQPIHNVGGTPSLVPPTDVPTQPGAQMLHPDSPLGAPGPPQQAPGTPPMDPRQQQAIMLLMQYIAMLARGRAQQSPDGVGQTPNFGPPAVGPSPAPPMQAPDMGGLSALAHQQAMPQ